ncbi:triadin [Polypterus senegalus]|uniref:triadin n=1 Tax=Polypterus senegalus TaxID=55291 RepID=UPI001965C804|nr:triadin [Polypterus senegalus]
MTEINTEGRAYATTTTVIDAKNGSISKLSEKTPKKSVADDLAATFSSPAAWLLVVALIFTWSAVAIVMFDLVDYKSYVGGIDELRSDPMKVIDEVVEESTDWIYGVMSIISDMVSPDDDDDDDDDEGDLDHHLKRRGEPPTRKRDSEVLDVSIMKKVEDNKKEDDKDDFLQKKSQKEKLGNSEEIYLDSDKDNMNEIERKEIILHPNKSHNNDGSYISNNGKSVHIDNETKYNKTSIQFSVQGGKRPNLNNSMKNVNRRIRIKDYVEDNFETLRNGRKEEGNEYHHQRNDIKNNCGTDKKTNCFTEEEEQDSNFKKCSKCSHKIINSSLERFEESLTKTVKANENKSLKRSFIYQNNSTYQNSVHNTSDENMQVDVKEETKILRIKGKKPNYENTKTEEVQDDYTSGNFHVARRTKEIPEKKVKDERKVPAKEVKKVTKEEVKAKKTAIPEKKVEKPKADVKAVEKTKSKGKAKEAESKDHLQFCRYVVHMYAHEDVSSVVVPMKQQIEVPKMKATTQAERPGRIKIKARPSTTMEKKPTVKPKEDKVKAEKTEIKQG